MKNKIILLTLLTSFIFGCTNNNDSNNLKIGIQTYSFRTMEDQSPLAILDYIKQTGIKNVELMGNHVESYAGAPESLINERSSMRLLYKQYSGETLSEEEKIQAQEYSEKRKIYEQEVAEWRKNVDLNKLKELRGLYNEAGIDIYAFKPRVFEKENTDDDIRYGMRAAKALGASHVTLEHPSDDKHTFRLSKIAEEEDVLIGYHGHEQQTPTFWDTAITQSKYNKINLDFGHYVAGDNENVVEFVKENNNHIVSMHLKDRKKGVNGGDNLPFGEGDTPIADVVRLINNEGYTFPITIELEYNIPEGSNSIEEIKKCLNYINNSLAEYN
ncbi:MAG: sugar phosphate isomerase/epimerase [Cryomorphaceae bacterium]|jgi:sugar phosphate isomerase/epimerase|nr:sugar phosphate isomerase/epimerase [Cryomorphaceae bacterium]MBT3502882.1 sugar phosphate isomerase/epimerase [Cryomorphaceae bacterium]MBT3688742.1 sugar phosphate isomerase/epimerase [Cryomorphaceae bacterium]MBT4222737.1 sugar phosphate isomerase/epimerase [Cryomorphaceae bacterium]MBT4292943.1 sugar phosphate isomerase/epimerase [Cryomorphaceae bacterium]